MKKLVGILIFLAAAGGGTYYYFKYGKPVEKPQVVQAKVSRGDIIEVVNATGTLEPMRRVDVGSQVSGVVQEIFVDYNHIVKQGQVLAKIDPSLLQVQVEIQQANIERQKMDIENQKVQLEDLKVKLQRSQALFDKQLVNQQQLDDASLAVKNREAQISSAQKQMVQSEAQLSQAKLNVSYTTILSPIDGVVLERRVDRGQTVQSSMNAPTFFALVTDLRTLRLSAGVDEADIGRVEVGQKVMFKVDAYGGQEFEGTVDTVRLNATNTNNVVTYPVWIKVPNPELKLRPAMTATLRVIIQTATNVVRVPNQALRFRPNNEIYTALGIEPPAAGRGRSLASELNDTNGAGAGRAQGGQGRDRLGTTPPARPAGHASGWSAGSRTDAGRRGPGRRQSPAGRGPESPAGWHGLRPADRDGQPHARADPAVPGEVRPWRRWQPRRRRRAAAAADAATTRAVAAPTREPHRTDGPAGRARRPEDRRAVRAGAAPRTARVRLHLRRHQDSGRAQAGQSSPRRDRRHLQRAALRRSAGRAAGRHHCDSPAGPAAESAGPEHLRRATARRWAA